MDNFSEKYKKCRECQTLINTPRKNEVFYEVENDEDDFYGKKYWTGHQVDNYGYPNIFQRSRQDLTGRCLYWLRKVMEYKGTPGKTLEIGSGPGAFVQMLKSVGFEAKGLELSPWVANYGRNYHGVEIINSKIEDVSENMELKDIVVMMDVLEHFTDPVESMRHTLSVIKNDGIIVIQTPCYNHMSYEEMIATNDPFLIQLKDQEHLYLFSTKAVTMLLESYGFKYINFIDPLFPYDMFLIASAEELVQVGNDQVTAHLQSKPETRLILALLDLYDEVNRVSNEAEIRLANNKKLEQLLSECEYDREVRIQTIHKLESLLKESEADREARLQSIQKLEELLKESEADREARLQSIQKLEELLKESEADREARLIAIQKLESLLKESEIDREARLESIQKLEKLLQEKQGQV
ncbi:class I SAM-dependent methyltransferase [Paenibacillus oryzisoli]|nr:class I SAM-dependent methyltransferase [Paenibacillus oryzisoli]